MTDLLRRATLLASVAALSAACATHAAKSVSLAVPTEIRIGNALAARLRAEPYHPARVRETCKVWHELHAPDGRVITKGLGGEFEHHRGLFFGFNQTKVGTQSLDFWHCNKGESQRRVGSVAPSELGLSADWQVTPIAWTDATGTTVVMEHRALRACAIDARTWRFDLISELRADREVTLSGDPQHSGCQFRALAQFADKDAPKVRYLRPAGAIAHDNDVWTNCAWIAAVLPMEGEPVTVVRVEHRGNPTEVRWSTRDYGRFGATFAHTLKPGTPLRVAYSYVVAVGALDAIQCETLATQITDSAETPS